MPLNAIHNVGGSAVSEIIKERNDNGRFTDFYNFVARTYGKSVNKKTIDIKARQVAYDELKERGSDVSKLDTDGIDLGHQKKKTKVQYKNTPTVEIKVPNKWQAGPQAKPFTASKMAETYSGLDDDKLLKVLNSKTLNPYARHLAWEEAGARGIDESKIDVSGTLKEYWDKQTQAQAISGKTAKTSDEDELDDLGGGSIYEMSVKNFTIEDAEDVMKEFPGGDDGWKNPNDPRTRKAFNNFVSLSDRKKYDAFIDYQKRQDPNYIPPVEQIQDLNAEYLDFLEGKATSFLISAGGAGVGKTWGFKKICELLNLQRFDSETMKPGDADYDWVIAPNIKSEKQLNEFLAQHNGKIILFDDNDAILTRQDMKAVMKTISLVRPREGTLPSMSQSILHLSKMTVIRKMTRLPN